MATKKKSKPAKQTPAPSAKKVVRKTFTPEQRAKILADAKAQNLTGKQVAKRYGISMVTYYLWRKKAGSSRRRTGGRQKARTNHDLTAQLRTEVRAKVQRLVPGIVRDEVARYLKAALK